MKNTSFTLIDGDGHSIHIMADGNRVTVGVCDGLIEYSVSLNNREAKAVAKAIEEARKNIAKKVVKKSD